MKQEYQEGRAEKEGSCTYVAQRHLATLKNWKGPLKTHTPNNQKLKVNLGGINKASDLVSSLVSSCYTRRPTLEHLNTKGENHAWSNVPHKIGAGFGGTTFKRQDSHVSQSSDPLELKSHTVCQMPVIVFISPLFHFQFVCSVSHTYIIIYEQWCASQYWCSTTQHRTPWTYTLHGPLCLCINGCHKYSEGQGQAVCYCQYSDKGE